MSPEVQVGMPAPDFRLPSTHGEIALSDFRGKNVVLYFYPRDNTPGCTREAVDFQERLDQFAALGTVVLGVSTDSLASHQRFCEKQNLTFPLLSDADGAVATRYGAYGEKKMMGRTHMGIIRSTFVIDRDGIVRYARRGVKVEGHAEEVLRFIREHLR
ncbi:MAG: thioredoxin-dependent thiol peroxidase [Firmicutes bacterium]|nr:thioredoxin-dependent thiol peroxidase [Bacillota bacterium]